MIIALLFLLLITIMTYPLVFKITVYIPAFFSTDESYAVVWHAWFTKFSLLNSNPLKTTDLISYPFGVEPDKIMSYLFFGIHYILSILTTPILTYNLLILTNFFLNTLFSYLLVRYLTNNIFAAIFSGIIFGFCPYVFVRAWQHLGETFLWMMPMTLLGLFILRFNSSKKAKTFCIIGLVLTTINFNAVQYIIIIMLTFIAYLFFQYLIGRRELNIIYASRNIRHFKNVIIIGLFAWVIVTPQFYPIIKNIFLVKKTIPSVFNSYYRPFEDLFIQSARPLSYFLPSIVHPVFGKFTEQFIGSSLYGRSITEHTLYLGWTPLVFALIAFRRWKRRCKERQNFHIGFFILLTIVAWFFSQPPWWKIGPIKIFMPSFFMYKILPMFRAYCRFGIVVMLAISVLAGSGLIFFLERFKIQRAKIIITLICCGLVLFEFWNYPPFKVMDISRPPAVYYWLKEQPKDIVIAEYPLDVGSPNEMYKLYQITHEKRMINYTIPGTHAHDVAKTIQKLSSPEAAKILKSMNVKFVVVHKENYLNTELIEDKEELDSIPANRGLKFIKSFPSQECHDENIMCIQKAGPIDIYEVVAESRGTPF